MNLKRMLLLAMLAAMVAEGTAQQSGTPGISLYGFIKLETLYDNTEIAQGDWQLYAMPGG